MQSYIKMTLTGVYKQTSYHSYECRLFQTKTDECLKARETITVRDLSLVLLRSPRLDERRVRRGS